MGTSYRRLAVISVPHKTPTYRKRRIVCQKTRPMKVAIGERRKPVPEGLRIDTVHQGALDGFRVCTTISAVDELTQWQVIGATSRIINVADSGAWRNGGAAGSSLHFSILGFHADNGARDHQLHGGPAIEQAIGWSKQNRGTRHSSLVNGKNGAVIRTLMGYGHITADPAEAIGVSLRKPCRVPMPWERPSADMPSNRNLSEGRGSPQKSALPMD
jgi:hypothetical protein